MAIALANKLNVNENTGAVSVQIKFGLTECLTNPNVSVQGKTMWGYLYLTDYTYERTLETLSNVFGFNSEDIREINDNPYLFEGINVILVTDIEEYEGKTYEKVKFINHPNGGAGKPLDDIEASKVNDMLKGKIRAFHQRNKQNGQSGQPVKTSIPPVRNSNRQNSQSSGNNYNSNNNSPPYNDDDLPF